NIASSAPPKTHANTTPATASELMTDLPDRPKTSPGTVVNYTPCRSARAEEVDADARAGAHRDRPRLLDGLAVLLPAGLDLVVVALPGLQWRGGETPLAPPLRGGVAVEEHLGVRRHHDGDLRGPLLGPGKHALPVVLHADDGPALLLRLVVEGLRE